MGIDMFDSKNTSTLIQEGCTKFPEISTLSILLEEDPHTTLDNQACTTIQSFCAQSTHTYDNRLSTMPSTDQRMSLGVQMH